MRPTRIDVPAAIEAEFADVFGENVRNGEFFCPWKPTGKPRSSDLLKWQLGKKPFRDEKRREQPVPPDSSGLQQFMESSAATKLMWLGHATFLIEIDGWRCLVDPVYGNVGLLVKRFGAEPVPIAALPEVHAVILTHGHYDHLDTQTLSEVQRHHPNAQYLAPLGQDAYVPKACGDVLTFDWWHQAEIGPVRATFVPMQHWHRRGAFDYNKALWGGWVFEGSKTVLHSGDSGYFPGFSAIGQLFDIDVALLPVGAYEPRWFMQSQHMNPEDSLRAFEDLRAATFIAMHWGTYDLTDEPLNRGAEEIRRLAEEAGVTQRVHTPAPGGFVAG